MKIRNDFVTNSSSASYILGKAEDTQFTVDSTYQLLRKIYREALCGLKRLAEDNAETFAELGINATFNNDYGWRFDIDKSDKEKESVAFNALMDIFGEDYSIMDMYGGYDYHWLDCGSYEEYLQYFEKKSEREKNAAIPFKIIDMSKDTGCYWDVGDAVEWYDIDIDPSYLGSLYFDGNCMNCLCECDGHYAGEGWCDEKAEIQLEKCRGWKEKHHNGTADNLFLLRFGRILIISGHELNMPYPVHIALEKIAVYGCCHMG